MELKGMWHGMSVVRNRAARALIVGATIAIFADGAWGQCELQKLLASESSHGARFGNAIAASGDVCVIGSVGCYSELGAAFVFRFDGVDWSEDAMLMASDGGSDDYFGEAVAVDGEVVVVGADRDDNENGSGAGSAYVFRYDGQNWSEEAKLIASDGANYDYFGVSVGISGEFIVVGAYENDDNGYASGSAYVFRYDGASWTEETKLRASDAQGGDFFGRAVAIDDDVIIVGAFEDDDDKGSAYVFRWTGSEWGEEAKLCPDDPDRRHFGYSVALDDGCAVVGAPNDDEYYSGKGATFIYRFDASQWSLDAKVIPSDVDDGDEFGLSVAIQGDIMLAGAPSLVMNSTPGYACVFKYDGSTWVQEATLLSSDLAMGDRLGSAVAIAGGQALVGAVGDDLWNGVNWYGTGATYLFHAGLDGEDCNGNLVADSCDIAIGESTDCQYNGIPDECDIDYGTSDDVNADGIPDECVIWSEPCEGVKIENIGGSDGDDFGDAVDIHGEVAIVGIPGWQGNTGAARIFHWNGVDWIVEAELEASDGGAYECFGCSVGINDDVAVVGAYNYSGGGAAYVFRFDGSTWNEEAKLTDSEGMPGDEFGWSVAVDGDVIVVGAPKREYWHELQTGCVYVYRYSSAAAGERGDWIEEARLLASDGDDGDRFGESVGIDGNLVLVGAPFDDDEGSQSGSAYFFSYDGSTWGEEVKVLAGDGGSDERFGSSVSLSGDVAIIGAPRVMSDWNWNWEVGAVYIFRHDSAEWNLEVKIFNPKHTEFGWFGETVDICGETAVVGRYHYGSGTWLYRYDGENWIENKLEGDGTGGFGADVAIDGDLAIAGSPVDGPIDEGLAFLFSGMIGLDCNANGIADGCDIHSGTSDDLNNNGIPDECEECPEDLNGSGVVDIDDLFQVLSVWGTCDDCPEDLNDDGVVDIDDLFAVLAAWGPC